MRRQHATALLVAALALAACGGEETATGLTPPSSAPTSSDVGPSTDAVTSTPASTPATTDVLVSSTAATTTSAPTTTMAPPPPRVLDAYLGQTIVGGHVYDVCTLLDPAVFLAVVGVEGGQGFGWSLSEFARSVDAEFNADDREGAVSCRYGPLMPDDNHRSPELELRVWSDDTLRFSTADPAATALARMGVVEAGMTKLSDEAGIGDRAFAALDGHGSVAIVATQGSVLVSLAYDAADDDCFSDRSAIQQEPCVDAQLQALRVAVQAAFPLIAATLGGGTGPSATFPPFAPPSGTAQLVTRTTSVDLCAAALPVVTTALGGVALEPVAAASDVDSISFYVDLEGGSLCTFTPVDRDASFGIEIRAFGPSSGAVGDLFAADKADLQDALPGVGEDAFAAHQEVEVMVDGVVFTTATTGRRSLDDPAVWAILVDIATGLAPQI